MISLAKLAVAGSLLAGAAYAHHSFAMFDMSKTTTVQGTVKDFLWENPHSWIDFYVTGPDGKPQLYSVEMGSPSGLYKAGWRASAINPGDKIIVTMHPLADGRNGGSIVGAILANGQHLGDLRNLNSPTGYAKPAGQP